MIGWQQYYYGQWQQYSNQQKEYRKCQAGISLVCVKTVWVGKRDGLF